MLKNKNTLSAEEFKVEQFTLDVQHLDYYQPIKGVSKKTVVMEHSVANIYVSVGSYGFSISLNDEREFFSSSQDLAEFCFRVISYFNMGGKRADIKAMIPTVETEIADAATKKINDKASANAKLKALGLTDDEIEALK